MRSSLHSLFAASVAVFAFSATGCSAATDASVDSVTQSDDALATTSAYYRLESKNADGSYVVSRANGGNIECPGIGTTKKCIVPSLVLPADCGFECTDGLLSLRGVSIVRGVLASVADATSKKRIARLTATAGFDTFDGTLGSYPIYRVTQTSVVCKKAPCAPVRAAVKLNATASTTVSSVDFALSHDPNYVLDPARGVDQMTRPEGLLATGTIAHGVFKADRVWRQWTPVADCDVLAAARAHFFQAPGADEVNLEFPTTLAAETYKEPQSRQVNWLVKTTTDANAVAFTGGINDLWAETFDVSTRTCAVTVTGEH